jgi:hypothetical protein
MRKESLFFFDMSLLFENLKPLLDTYTSYQDGQESSGWIWR